MKKFLAILISISLLASLFLSFGNVSFAQRTRTPVRYNEKKT